MEESTRTVEGSKTEEKTSTFGKFKNWAKEKLKDDKKAQEALEGINREEFKHFGDWLAEGNCFGFYNEDERDEKKVGWSADRAANELFVTTYGGVAAVSLGAALLPFCPILGILIIVTGTIPRPVAEKLKESVNEKTFGLIPLDKIPSPTGKLSDLAHNTHANIDTQMKNFGAAVKVAEEALKKQKQEEAAQRQRQAATGAGAKQTTPKVETPFSDRFKESREALDRESRGNQLVPHGIA